MPKKWKKIIGFVLLFPILLAFIITLLFYLPPVQNFAQRKVMQYISEATGMQISIDRLLVRFPIGVTVEGVKVIQQSDTLLQLDKAEANIQLWPLLKGNVVVDDLFLHSGRVHTAGLVEGMELNGTLGNVYVNSREINLSQSHVPLRRARLKDIDLELILKEDTTAQADTATSPSPWLITLESLQAQNLRFRLHMPADSTTLETDLADATLKKLVVNLPKERYELASLAIGGKLLYDQGNGLPAEGFDSQHIALDDVVLHLDSLSLAGTQINACLTRLQLTERSGLQITSAAGRILSDSQHIIIPELFVRTPSSSIDLQANTGWDYLWSGLKNLDARLDVVIGRDDVMRFAGGLSEDFRNRYPAEPLKAQLIASGQGDNIRFSALTAELPGAFTLNGQGELRNLTDSRERSGSISMNMRTGRLDFLKSLAGMGADTTLVIPRGMNLTAGLEMKAARYNATVTGREGGGGITLKASLNGQNETYTADVHIDSLQIAHLLPHQQMGRLTTSLKAEGQGLDFSSPKSKAKVTASVDRLEYGKYIIKNINLDAGLKNSQVEARLNSQNELIVMDAWGQYRLNTPHTVAKASINVADIDLYQLGLIDAPMRNTLSLSLSADIREDSLSFILFSGDLQARLRSRSSLEELISKSAGFTDVLMKQFEKRKLDHTELREALPRAVLTLKAGSANPISRYLAYQKISFSDFSAGFIASPRLGLNGRAAIHTLKVDTFQLDTLYLAAFQDTARINLRAGAINGAKNPNFALNASVTGEIRTRDAELTLRYKDGEGKTGLLLGANVTPGNYGYMVKFIPEKPVIAEREFSFNHHNKVYVRDNGRVLADVEMLDKDGMGFRIHSMPDTTYLQNLDIEVRRIDLGDISKMLPYFPAVSGFFFMEAKFQQTEKDMTLSAEGRINDLAYENAPVGNVGLAATWLPGENGKHYVDGYFSLEEEEIMKVNGSYDTQSKTPVKVDALFEHFPLHIAGAFVPDHIVGFKGDMDGSLTLSGTAEAPLANGSLMLDSVSVYSEQYGLNFAFDNRPVQIKDSRLTFDKFAIYTTPDNPFTIDGNVNFSKLDAISTNLTLQARNYRLLDAQRKKGSLLYGKVFVDTDATISGLLDNLRMRGNINLLGNTKVNYVLADSPLTVQDRLGDLVVFTSFEDTLSAEKHEPVVVSVGGMDIRMTINVDQAVQLGVDLSTDRKSYVDLEGGGNLSFQYTPQGEMTLTGRYELMSGTMKYSLPVIPLKEFKINEGSFVEWTGNVMNPRLNFKASERIRTSVSDGGGGGERMVNFDVSIGIRNTLNDLELVFDLEAPEDPTIKQNLQAMAPEERSKQAVALMATGMYLAGGANSGNLNMGSALNSVLQKQINSIAGSALKNVNLSLGMDSYESDGQTHTDYNFKYAQRFFNDRVQVVIGGSISTDKNADNTQSFIDNVSLEYRLDRSGTRYVRLFHNKNYESVLEGEITETGVGLVLRKKVNRLGELFLFRKKK